MVVAKQLSLGECGCPEVLGFDRWHMQVQGVGFSNISVMFAIKELAPGGLSEQHWCPVNGC
jgi:hypothetical protein